jgi:hypothetical protein
LAKNRDYTNNPANWPCAEIIPFRIGCVLLADEAISSIASSVPKPSKLSNVCETPAQAGGLVRAANPDRFETGAGLGFSDVLQLEISYTLGG